MAIQWFPGHMHLTRKAIEERIKEIDVVIELLDARLPGSSANPMLAQLTAGKPALKVLKVYRVLLDSRDQPALRVSQVFKARPVLREQMVRKVLQVPKVLSVFKVKQVLRELMDFKAPLEPKV